MVLFRCLLVLSSLPTGSAGRRIGCMAASGSSLIVSRRGALIGCGTLLATSLPLQPAYARVPGSSDVGEAIEQILEGTVQLRQLQRDWSTYACIDAEGRAVLPR